METVQWIRGILQDLGVTPVEHWIDSGVSGCYSLRVELAPLGIGQNGKGATAAYALASAYAELMERMQNDLLYTGQFDEETWQEEGFFFAPDELGAGDQPEGISVPFFRLKEGDLVPFSVSELRSIYYTNGTCAGNTKEEALVQGLSELFERYANLTIVRERRTLPTISREYLQRYPDLMETILSIEQEGSFQVVVKDASLGMGFPVVSVLLIDHKKQSYLVRFGAHPIFEIALERTLTELLQGWNLKESDRMNRIVWGFDRTDSPVNLHNILKNGSGRFPASYFLADSSAKEPEFPDLRGKTNKELFRWATEKIWALGLDLFIRDVSFLGFPTYQIVVPGFSEIYGPNDLRLREKGSLEKVRNILRKLPEATEKEWEQVIRYLTYKQDYVMENTLEYTLGLPLKWNPGTSNLLGGKMATIGLLALCHYQLGNVVEAHRGIHVVAEAAKMVWPDGALDFAYLRDYLNMLAEGIDGQQAVQTLSLFYPSDVHERVSVLASSPNRLMETYLPMPSCFQCETCARRPDCNYQDLREWKRRLKKIQKSNQPDQKLSGLAIKRLLEEQGDRDER